MSNKNIIAMELKRIKEKHGLTNESWSKISKVPVSTIARYLSASSFNMPTALYFCAMLRSINESVDEFYDIITKNANAPSDAVKLDTVPVGVIADGALDVPEAKVEIQERIILQAEEMQRLKDQGLEKDLQIEALTIQLDHAERKMEAIKALCSA